MMRHRRRGRIITPGGGGGGGGELVCTTTLGSLDQGELQDAIDGATDGDVICLPAGTGSWTTTLDMTAKAVTIHGQGIGQTIINDQVSGIPMMNMYLKAGFTSRLSGIEFQEDGGGGAVRVNVYGNKSGAMDDRRIRIDGCKFDHLSGECIIVTGAWGCIHDNEFYYIPTNRALNVNWGDPNRIDDCELAWANGINWGSENWLFFERNHCEYDSGTFYAHIDTFNGGAWVARYNTIINGWIEMHGTDSCGRMRGGRAVEAYNNSFTSDVAGNYVMNGRSGVWVCYNNTAIGYGSPIIEQAAYRQVQRYTPWGGADGTNPWDSNVGGGPWLNGTTVSSATGTGEGGGTVTVTGAGWTPGEWEGYSIRKTNGRIAVTAITHNGSNPATVTVHAVGHGLAVNDYVHFRGADQILYNNLSWVVASVADADHFTFSLLFGQQDGLATPATGTITLAKGGGDFGLVWISTSDTLTFSAGTLGGTVNLKFQAGDTFQLWKVNEAMDQPGRGSGSNLGTSENPSVPGGWLDQVDEPCYEWNNTKEAGASFTFAPDNPEVVRSGEHFFEETEKPGYTAYTYPHPMSEEP